MTPDQENFLLNRLNRLETQNQALIHHLAETNRLLFNAIAHASNADLAGLTALARQVEANLAVIRSLTPNPNPKPKGANQVPTG
jgi:hypothetical protein